MPFCHQIYLKFANFVVEICIIFRQVFGGGKVDFFCFFVDERLCVITFIWYDLTFTWLSYPNIRKSTAYLSYRRTMVGFSTWPKCHYFGHKMSTMKITISENIFDEDKWILAIRTVHTDHKDKFLKEAAAGWKYLTEVFLNYACTALTTLSPGSPVHPDTLNHCDDHSM